jgi:hypothetical protein
MFWGFNFIYFESWLWEICDRELSRTNTKDLLQQPITRLRLELNILWMKSGVLIFHRTCKVPAVAETEISTPPPSPSSGSYYHQVESHIFFTISLLKQNLILSSHFLPCCLSALWVVTSSSCARTARCKIFRCKGWDCFVLCRAILLWHIKKAIETPRQYRRDTEEAMQIIYKISFIHVV